MIEYIFSINPGRSGSQYLQKLFSCVPGTSSHHEPEPVMNRKILTSYLYGDSKLLENRMQTKLKAIDLLKEGNIRYVETNHAFIKGFGWLIPEFLPQEKTGVVILKRNDKDVINSLTKIKCNAINNDGRYWLIHVDKKNKIVNLPENVGWPRITYYSYRLLYIIHLFLKKRLSKSPLKFIRNIPVKEMVIPKKLNDEFLQWYIDELYAMSELYQQKFPGITYLTINLEELNELQAVENMFKVFGISSYNKEQLKSIIGVKFNER